MNCLECGWDTIVTDSRPVAYNRIRRRRKCLKCGYKFITYEFAYDSSKERNYGKVRDKIKAQVDKLKELVEQLE